MNDQPPAMGWTIKTSSCSRVTLSSRSPVAMSKGCAPVLASYSAMTRFTCSMSAVAGSYSRRVVSPTDENVRILAFMFGLLWTFVRGFLREATARFGSCCHFAPFLSLVINTLPQALRFAAPSIRLYIHDAVLQGQAFPR